MIPGLFQVLEMLVASCKASCGKAMISCPFLQCMGVLVASFSCQSLVLSVNLNFSHLYECVVLFHVYFFHVPETNDMEYFFLCLLLVCISSLVMSWFESLVHFKFGVCLLITEF